LLFFDFFLLRLYFGDLDFFQLFTLLRDLAADVAGLPIGIITKPLYNLERPAD
jgi:hypothetical protein